MSKAVQMAHTKLKIPELRERSACANLSSSEPPFQVTLAQFKTAVKKFKAELREYAKTS